MAHDLKAEIAAALKADDSAALAQIAYILLGRVQQVDEQREKENERKRNWRNGRHATDATSGDGMRRDATSPDVIVNEPVHTLPTRSTTPHTQRAREVAAVDEAQLLKAIDAARARYGSSWDDVDAFLRRRDYAKWPGWLDEMAKLVGITSQFTPDDLARVCRDDRLLANPIGSAYALRKFLQQARIERLAGGERAPPPVAARSGSFSRRDTKATKASTGPPAPPTDSIADVKWQT